VTVRVKPVPPWSALLGESETSVGARFTAVTVKATALEVPPSRATTVIGAEPAVVRSLAGMLALSFSRALYMSVDLF
jgi:hypothetical protein